MSVRYSIGLGSWPVAACPSGGFFTALARRVEELGFGAIYVGDHLQIGLPIPEPMTILGHMSAVTERLRIGPMVLLLGLRPLVLAAKELATLDHLSDGRLTVGIGVGGEHPGEWAAAGVPLRQRGARTDAYLEILPALMMGQQVTHASRYVDIADVQIEPAAAQSGGPPIWIGGRSDAALTRAGRHQGWCAYAESPNGFARKRDQIIVTGCPAEAFTYAVMVFTRIASRSQQAADALRAELSMRYGENFARAMGSLCAYGTTDEVRDKLALYGAAGATEIVLSPLCREDELDEQLARLSEITTCPVP